MVLALECPGVRIFFNEEKQRRICFRLSLSPEPVPTGTEVGSVRGPLLYRAISRKSGG